ncbi:MAG: hypothetical protein Q7U78_10205 [Gallionella sp.]|nr:hypothetical protein [Gallionella sp.]
MVVTKFSRQAADLSAVFLYKEGLFVRAYNEGAYGFIHQVLACKPMRRFVKSIAGDRVVCGVPFTVVAALPGFAQASQLDALTWRWPLAEPVERALYEAWREALPLVMPGVSVPTVEVGDAAQVAPNLAQRLIDQLIQFNLVNNSPLAALNLVADLQRQWQEREVA